MGEDVAIDPFDFGPWVSDAAAANFRTLAAAPDAPMNDLAALRAHYDAYNQDLLDEALDVFRVDLVRDTIAGVPVHLVTPPNWADDGRVLLCLHGGAFQWGRGAGALLEAVPVAATAGIRVIAVEYALAPEQVFPVAVDDVLAVYRAVINDYAPGAIGIYGCSAGGVLTAQAVARMIADDVPRPGAIAMLHGTGIELGGDSVLGMAEFSGRSEQPGLMTLAALPYFTDADMRDPLVFPGEHSAVLADFPPSLLITGTRDFASGSCTVMHRRLLAAGVAAELIQFDGMWHAFHMATTLPESCETFAALARFFRAHLR